jgi:trehalose 6-phosphate phosphatase
MPLAGQHGLERRDAAGRLWIHAAPPAAKCSFKEALAPVLARHPGLLLEDKGLTLALHYRRAPHLAPTPIG